MQKRWKFFLKNIKDDTLELTIVIDEIQKFLEPVFDAIVNEAVGGRMELNQGTGVF